MAAPAPVLDERKASAVRTAEVNSSRFGRDHIGVFRGDVAAIYKTIKHIFSKGQVFSSMWLWYWLGSDTGTRGQRVGVQGLNSCDVLNWDRLHDLLRCTCLVKSKFEERIVTWFPAGASILLAIRSRSCLLDVVGRHGAWPWRLWAKAHWFSWYR